MSMSEDPRGVLVATVRAAYDAFNERDLEAALAFVHPEAELRPLGTSTLTGREVYVGVDGIRDYFADVGRVWDQGLRVYPVDFRAVAGSVVVFGRVEGATTDMVPVEDEVLWVWRLRDGLLYSCQIFSTRREALAAAESAA
jgi:ketosteroid isomerase-like protein